MTAPLPASQEVNLAHGMEVHADALADQLTREAVDLEDQAHAKRLEAALYRDHARVAARHRVTP